MKNALCLALAALALLVMVSIATSTTAEARIYHRHHTHYSSSNSAVREAQTHLSNLGYYKGKIDGVIGPKTRTAIKSFQREHGLKVDGVLGKKTIAALIRADKTRAMAALPLPKDGVLAPPAPDFYAKNPDFYGHYDQQYGDPMTLARVHQDLLTQGLPSRFAQIKMTEVPSGDLKRFDVMVNGQEILLVDNQPSVIGVSRTFDLGNEDGIIFSAYNPVDPVCSFKHYLMVLRDGASTMYPVGNCTRGYQANIKENSLFITFPEIDDGREAGAVWRYEAGHMERL